jgi:hypothetical protein
MFAVGAVELPKLDDVDEADEEELAAGRVVSLAFGALRMPEVLTEMHGGDVLPAAAPMGIPEVVKVFAELTAPPAKVGSAVSQGGAFRVLANDAVAPWEIPETSPIPGPSGDVAAIPPVLTVPLCAELSVVGPKSAPSGDVAPMPPGVCIVVCAQPSPTPSVVMARIKTAERQDFIETTFRRENQIDAIGSPVNLAMVGGHRQLLVQDASDIIFSRSQISIPDLRVRQGSPPKESQCTLDGLNTGGGSEGVLFSKGPRNWPPWAFAIRWRHPRVQPPRRA